MGKQNGLRGHFLLFPFALFKLSMRLFKTYPQKHSAPQLITIFTSFLQRICLRVHFSVTEQTIRVALDTKSRLLCNIWCDAGSGNNRKLYSFMDRFR